MVDKKPSGNALPLNIEFVKRVENADLIAIGLRHESEERTIAAALTRRDATVLLVHLMDVLRTEDIERGKERPLHATKEGGSATLAIRKIDLVNEGKQAVLLMTTDDGLQIPFSFPIENVERIAAMLSSAALKMRGEVVPDLKH